MASLQCNPWHLGHPAYLRSIIVSGTGVLMEDILTIICSAVSKIPQPKVQCSDVNIPKVRLPLSKEALEIDTPLLPLTSKCVWNTISNHLMILHPLWCYFVILRLTLCTWTHIVERPGLIAFYISICSSGRFDFISLSLNIFHSKLLLYIFIPPFLLSPLKPFTSFSFGFLYPFSLISLYLSPFSFPLHSIPLYCSIYLQTSISCIKTCVYLSLSLSQK